MSEETPKQGYIVGPSPKASAVAASNAGWRMLKGMNWQTPRGDAIRLAPDGYAFPDLSKKRVCYFVPGWESRRDAIEIAYGLGLAQCETLTMTGEPVVLDEAFVRKLAVRAAS